MEQIFVDRLLEELRRELRRHANKEHAAVAQRFFKTGAGEYGEGDLFLGVRVPAIRRLVKTCPETQASDLKPLLQSPFHEERMLALLSSSPTTTDIPFSRHWPKSAGTTGGESMLTP